MHLVISWIGFTYIRAEISHSGNEQLLNDLNEGVLIIEEPSGMILFNNKAARHLNVTLNQSNSTAGGDKVFDMSAKNFAPLSPGIFISTLQDKNSSRIIKLIREEREYISIDDIVEQQSKNGPSNVKKIYKVHHALSKGEQDEGPDIG